MPDQNQNFSLSKSFVRGELSLGFWGFVKKGVGMLHSFFVLSSLLVYQFGVYQLLQSAYAFASDFFHSTFSSVVSNDLFRAVGENKEAEAKRLFWEYAFFRLAIGIFPAVIIFLLAPLLSFRYGSEAILWIRIFSFLFVIDALLPLGLLLLKLRLQFNALALQPIVQKTIQVLVVAYFYFFSQLDIRQILIAQVAAPTLTLLILLPFVIKSYGAWRGIKMSSNPLLLPILKTYGKWEVPQFLTSDFNGRIRPWLIKLFINTEAVGIFSVAYTFISAFKDLLPIRTLSILIPRKVLDKNYFNLFFLYGTKYYILMSLLLCFGAAATVPIAIYLLFPRYVASLPLFYLLLPLLPIFGFTKIINVLLVAKRRQKYIFFQSLLQYGLSFFFLILWLPTIGLWGLPLAEVLATISANTIKYYYLIKTKFIDRFPFKKLFSFGEQDRLILSILRHNFLAFFHKK